MKQQVKNEQIKRKQTCSVSFVKVFQFQENKFKISWKTNQSRGSLHDKYGWPKAEDWQ